MAKSEEDRLKLGNYNTGEGTRPSMEINIGKLSTRLEMLDKNNSEDVANFTSRLQLLLARTDDPETVMSLRELLIQATQPNGANES